MDHSYFSRKLKEELSKKEPSRFDQLLSNAKKASVICSPVKNSDSKQDSIHDRDSATHCSNVDGKKASSPGHFDLLIEGILGSLQSSNQSSNAKTDQNSKTDQKSENSKSEIEQEKKDFCLSENSVSTTQQFEAITSQPNLSVWRPQFSSLSFSRATHLNEPSLNVDSNRDANTEDSVLSKNNEKVRNEIVIRETPVLTTEQIIKALEALSAKNETPSGLKTTPSQHQLSNQEKDFNSTINLVKDLKSTPNQDLKTTQNQDLKTQDQDSKSTQKQDSKTTQNRDSRTTQSQDSNSTLNQNLKTQNQALKTTQNQDLKTTSIPEVKSLNQNLKSAQNQDLGTTSISEVKVLNENLKSTNQDSKSLCDNRVNPSFKQRSRRKEDTILKPSVVQNSVQKKKFVSKPILRKDGQLIIIQDVVPKHKRMVITDWNLLSKKGNVLKIVESNNFSKVVPVKATQKAQKVQNDVSKRVKSVNTQIVSKKASTFKRDVSNDEIKFAFKVSKRFSESEEKIESQEKNKFENKIEVRQEKEKCQQNTSKSTTFFSTNETSEVTNKTTIHNTKGIVKEMKDSKSYEALLSTLNDTADIEIEKTKQIEKIYPKKRDYFGKGLNANNGKDKQDEKVFFIELPSKSGCEMKSSSLKSTNLKTKNLKSNNFKSSSLKSTNLEEESAESCKKNSEIEEKGCFIPGEVPNPILTTTIESYVDAELNEEAPDKLHFQYKKWYRSVYERGDSILQRYLNKRTKKRTKPKLKCYGVPVIYTKLFPERYPELFPERIAELAKYPTISFEERRFGVLSYPLDQIKVQFNRYDYYADDWSKVNLENGLRFIIKMKELTWINLCKFMEESSLSGRLSEHDKKILDNNFLMDIGACFSATNGNLLQEVDRKCLELDDEVDASLFYYELRDARGQAMRNSMETQFTFFGFQSLLPFIARTVSSFCRAWPGNRLLVCLALSILYYTPSRPGLIEKTKVWCNQSIFYDMVQRYFAHLYSTEREAKMAYRMYLEVLNRIRINSRQAFELVSQFTELKTASPLMARIIGDTKLAKEAEEKAILEDAQKRTKNVESTS